MNPPAAFSQPVLSVVIPVRNGAKVIATQLEALVEQHVEGGFEVVVADNGSTDGTRAVVESYNERLPVRVIDAAGRPGAGFARNRGVAASRGRLVVFLDADDAAHPGYLAAMVEGLGRAELVASSTAPEPLDGLSDAQTLDGVGTLRPGQLPWASTSNLGIRRDSFEAIGGFAEELRFAGEDLDLCWRAQLAGGRLELVPEAVLSYRLPATRGSHFRKGVRYGQSFPQLARRYPGWINARLAPLALLRTMSALCLRFITARGPGARSQASYLLGRNLGRLIGSLRFRSLRRIEVVWPADGR